MGKPNFLVRWLIQLKGESMLTKLFDALKGYKTYVLAVVGIVVALVGHFYGPVQLGSLSIPQMSWGDVWQVIWTSGLFSALRHSNGNTSS